MRIEEIQEHLNRNPEDFTRLEEIFGDKLGEAMKESSHLMALQQKLKNKKGDVYTDQYGQLVTLTENGIRKVGTISVYHKEHFDQEKKIQKANQRAFKITIISMIAIASLIFIMMSL